MPLAILIVFAALGLYMLYQTPPTTEDWVRYFRPATWAMLHGQSPYRVQDFHNAPWTLLPFIPLALLPYKLGNIAFFTIAMICFLLIAFGVRGKPICILLFMTSFPVINCLNSGGLDWLPMLSFFTPAPVSLIFAAMKPQIGLGVVLFYLWLGWETGGVRLLVRWFAPLFFLTALSFYVYGFWIMTWIGKWHNPWNISIFPYLIPLGLFIILKHKSKVSAGASSIFFAPYFAPFSLTAPLVALLQYPWLMFFVWVLTWIYGVIFYIYG